MQTPVIGYDDVGNLLNTVIAVKTYDQLLYDTSFANYFARDYEGDISRIGDTVKVNQFSPPVGEILTDDKQKFSTSPLVVTQLNIVANMRASAAYTITDMAQLHSVEFQNELIKNLKYALRLSMDQQILAGLTTSNSVINPSPSSVLTPANVASAATTLSINRVPKEDRVLLLDPNYYGDLGIAPLVISSDYTNRSNNSSEERLVQRYQGFEVAEHNLLATDTGWAFHKSAMQVVMQQGIRIKISDLHSNQEYASLISADMVFGYKMFDAARVVKISG